MTTYGIAKNGVAMKVELTELEARICNVLQGVSTLIAKERPDLPKIESRIAGGWVRDKLLGKECHDLDIAVNDMMGHEFATFVNKYLESQGHATESLSKITSNPEKSKHLETATATLFDQEIDFCNLRTEVYEPGSRIPSHITFGTPKQDAFRRDITINCLFYNVNTGKVEDLTELGLYDLVHGTIRTPVDAFESLLEDPLRVMRCIRFSSRFDFELSQELIEAAQHSDIQHALKTKISRERIGVEFEKMIGGPYPLLSIELLQRLSLYSIVIPTPEGLLGDIPDSSWVIEAVREVVGLADLDLFERRNVILCACVYPFSGMEVQQKKKRVPAVPVVLRDALKTTLVDVTLAQTIFRGLTVIQTLAHQPTVTRSELGMVIRDLGPLWKTAVLFASVKEAVDNVACYDHYQQLVQAAEKYEIQTCYEWKHKIDGKKASALIGLKPGPHALELLKVEMIWQLDHPDGSIEECEKAIQTYWAHRLQQ